MYGHPEQPRQRRDVADQRVDLLGADDRERHDRDAGAQRGAARSRRGRSAGACSAAENGLPMPLKPSGQTPTSSPPPQHPLGVLVAGQRGAALAGQLADERHPEDQVGAERPQVPAGVVVDGDHRHQGVDRDRARVVGDDQRAALGGDVLDAADLDPEPLLGDRPQQREHELLGDLVVEAELVDVVVAGQPAAQEGEQLGQLRLPLVAEDLARRRAGAPTSQASGEMPASGPRSAVVAAGRGRRAGGLGAGRRARPRS